MVVCKVDSNLEPPTLTRISKPELDGSLKGSVLRICRQRPKFHVLSVANSNS